MIALTLPYPPSVNTYWRSPNSGKLAGRTLISKKGREYRQQVQQTIKDAGYPKAKPGRLIVTIIVYPPDYRRRDLDNLPKAVLDSLTHAGVIEDDSLIDHLSIRRYLRYPGGKVFVTVAAFNDDIHAA